MNRADRRRLLADARRRRTLDCGCTLHRARVVSASGSCNCSPPPSGMVLPLPLSEVHPVGDLVEDDLNCMTCDGSVRVVLEVVG